MLHNRYFTAWVAQTITSISGIWPEHLCTPDGECVLTGDETSMVACQGVFATSFDLYKREFAPRSKRVSAHKRPAGETLH